MSELGRAWGHPVFGKVFLTSLAKQAHVKYRGAAVCV